MASCINFKEQRLFLNNMSFARMMEFVLQVAEATARSAEERELVAAFKKRSEDFWPGIGLDVETDFPTVAERKFWARCFHDLARWIFLRKIGKHEVDFWQAADIHTAYAIGNFFMYAAREYDSSFWPDSEDSQLTRAFYERRKPKA